MEITETLRYAERSFGVVFAEALACDDAIFGGFAAEVARQTGRPLPKADRTVELRPDRSTRRNGWGLRILLRGRRETAICLLAHMNRFDAAAAALAGVAAQETVVGEGDGARALTVWIAPRAALAEAPQARAIFDVLLPVESVTAALSTRAGRAEGELAARLRFQLRLIEQAQGAAASALEALDAMEHPFLRAYLAFLEARGAGFPAQRALEASLGQKRPSSIRFDADALPHWRFMPPVRLMHHFRAGAVAILIEGWSADLQGLARVMEPALRDTPFMLADAGKAPNGASLGVMIVDDAPPLDLSRPFEDQIGPAESCLGSLIGLREWYRRREGAARYWADYATGGASGCERSRIRAPLPAD
jgi:hypothetical protein